MLIKRKRLAIALPYALIRSVRLSVRARTQTRSQLRATSQDILLLHSTIMVLPFLPPSLPDLSWHGDAARRVGGGGRLS